MSAQKESSRLLGYAIVTTLTFCVLGVYALLAFNLKVFSPIAKTASDYSFEDFYYKILGSVDDEDLSNVVTIVDVTELTSRSELAELMATVSAMKPKVMGIDIVFEGLKEDSLADHKLMETAGKCHNAVFAYKLIDRTDEAVHSFFMPGDSLKEGFVNMPRQLYGGLKRSLNIGRVHQGQLVPSFVKQVADVYAGRETVALADKELRINFSPLRFSVIPYPLVTQHPELIADRVVLIGAMKEETDMHYTPQGKMAGTELLAFAVETLLRQNTLLVVPGWIVAITSFVLVLTVVILRAKYLRFAAKMPIVLKTIMTIELTVGLVMFIMIAAIVWVGFMLFSQYHVSLNLTYTVAAIAFIYTSNNLYETVKGQITKKKTS